METLQHWLGHMKDILDFSLGRLGGTEFTLWKVLYLIILVVLLFSVTGKVKRWIVDRLLAESKIDVGVREAMGSIGRYVTIVIGLLIILQTVGIDLTTLNVLAGAVGIGVGFGLQNIANNFISGLIILFERPIKVGDRIEVGPVEGDVTTIGLRSTTVITNDDIAIIVPNSKFISENVVNWSHTERKIRFKIPVSVSYDSDVRLVEKLLLEVARENPHVMEDPPPAVRFIEFGDSGLKFELRAWTTRLIHRKGRMFSELNFSIHDKFREHGISIPYPQRDLHLRDGSIRVSLTQASRIDDATGANGDWADDDQEAF